MFKLFSFVLYFTLLFGNATGQVNALIPDKIFSASSMHLKGMIGEKLDLSFQNRILAQDVDRLVIPFRNRTETSCWQSEFWGKWFTSAVLAYRYRPETSLKLKLENAVNGLISTQTPDGYIGNYADDKHLQSWDIWGRKYCMLGLIAYYDLTKESKALKAAGKIADHLINELQSRNALLIKMGNHRGMAASSVLEPICLLYSRTADKRYLNFAEEIVRQWESIDGPQLISKSATDVSKRFPKPQDNWYGWDQGQKAYEMMSCYEGLLELYRLTGKEEYREAVEITWANILKTEINVAGSGSAVECWFGGNQLQNLPILHYQETCVTVTWIKLSQQLLRLTGDAKYADAIEQAYYNALLGAMRQDGSDWAKYTPLAGQRLEGSEQCDMGLNCCVASGPRGLFTFPLTAIMRAKEGFQINFYAEGTYTLQSPLKQQVEIVQETNYPVTGKVILKIKLQKSENMSLCFRIPQWSSETVLKINDEYLTGIKSGDYANVNRVWKNNDQIELILDMRCRLAEMGTNPKYFAILKGPVVLSRDSRLSGPNLDLIITPIRDKDGFIKLESVEPKNSEIWMEFSGAFYPESYAEGENKPVSVRFCDYASAGNSKQGFPDFKVWLPQLFDPRE